MQDETVSGPITAVVIEHEEYNGARSIQMHFKFY